MGDSVEADISDFVVVYEQHCGSRPENPFGTYHGLFRRLEVPEVSGFLWNPEEELTRLAKLITQLKAAEATIADMPRFLSEKLAMPGFDDREKRGKMVPIADVLPVLVDFAEKTKWAAEDEAARGKGSRRLNSVAFNLVQFAHLSLDHHGIEHSISEHAKYPTTLQKFVADLMRFWGVEADPRSAVRAYKRLTTESEN